MESHCYASMSGTRASSLLLSLSLFLFHSRGSPITKLRDEEKRSAKRKRERERHGRQTKRETETLVITWLLCTREGGLSLSLQPSCSFSSLRSLIFFLRHRFFFLFFSRPRARFFFFFSFRSLFSPFPSRRSLSLSLSLEQRRVPPYDKHKHTDGRTRAHAYRKAETKCTRVNERVK